MSSPQQTTVEDDRAAVVAAVREHTRFLVTTHENPDGDALGSLLASKLTLDALGKEAKPYLAGALPLPQEYRFMELEDLVRGSAPDMDGRVLFAVDCANERRLGPDSAQLLEREEEGG